MYLVRIIHLLSLAESIYSTKFWRCEQQVIQVNTNSELLLSKDNETRKKPLYMSTWPKHLSWNRITWFFLEKLLKLVKYLSCSGAFMEYKINSCAQLQVDDTRKLTKSSSRLRRSVLAISSLTQPGVSGMLIMMTTLSAIKACWAKRSQKAKSRNDAFCKSTKTV